MAKLYDKDLKVMLEHLSASGALNDTFFMILGDHGFQRGEDPFILTEQGRVENNMLRDILMMGTNHTFKEIFPNFEGHGLSLFNYLGDRTCADAEVPEEYCSCTDGVMKLSVASLRPIAEALLIDINTFVQPLGHCQRLVLAKVKDATVKSTEDKKSINIQLEVGPIPAYFDASFSFNTETQKIEGCKLTRLDWYSDTSKCVPERYQYFKP